MDRTSTLAIGGYAVMKYTEPRYTEDLDVWVEPSRKNAAKGYKAPTKSGAPLDDVTPFVRLCRPAVPKGSAFRLQILFDLGGYASCFRFQETRLRMI
jgi:hypothetical protein